MRETATKPDPETPRQKFIRNNDEGVRIMRMRAIEARREGRLADAEMIDTLANVWDRIGDKAKREEAGNA